MRAPLQNSLGAGLRPEYLHLAGKGKISVLRGWAWWRASPCCTMSPVPKPKPARCEDCYFHQNSVAALNLSKPCTPFRPADRGLAPERQLPLVFRAVRTTAASALPAPKPYSLY